ncbi:hypothetical protein FN846DRAFT_894944 [Sphaerosporella brunnea]|uniref:Uncharacterized protein n=1 Tax=Sphaerosporella brunnea TaxID=1250544 RepID=A0A5J5EHL2_9PEZI|nr:hypothetical protein FN846DRAFT_894944 [Sphaerosporella brunnea]
MASSIHSSLQGRAPAAAAPDAEVATPSADAGDADVASPTADAPGAAVATPASAVETTDATGISLTVPLYRALPDNQTTVTSIAVATPSVDTTGAAVATSASDVEATVLSPPTIPASDVKKGKRKRQRKRKHQQMPIENGNPRKVPKLNSETSASNRVCLAVGNTTSIQVDVRENKVMDIALNVSPNGTVSRVIFSFGVSIAEGILSVFRLVLWKFLWVFILAT